MLQIVIKLKKYYKNQLPKNPQKILSIFARGEERIVNPLASKDVVITCSWPLGNFLIFMTYIYFLCIEVPFNAMELITLEFLAFIFLFQIFHVFICSASMFYNGIFICTYYLHISYSFVYRIAIKDLFIILLCNCKRKKGI